MHLKKIGKLLKCKKLNNPYSGNRDFFFGNSKFNFLEKTSCAIFWYLRSSNFN